MTTQETGSIGEGIAASYLASRGYDVRERNVRFKKLEIDIIAYDRAEKMMVFVEVKTRKTHSSEYPIHAAVDKRKRKNIRRAVSKWLTMHRYQDLARIDVISVCNAMVVEHICDLGSDFY